MELSTRPVRVRFAPSPTGELHLGGARTALYDFLFAKREGGAMVLRVEDTDQKRYVEGSMERFFEDLKWLGITVDEGPEQGGPYEPYIQSQRSDRHREVAEQLVKLGFAYYEFQSESDQGNKREDEEYREGRSVYRGQTRDSYSGEQGFMAAQKEMDFQEDGHGTRKAYAIRLKVPLSGTIVVDDIVRGEVSFDLATVDDAVLLKSDGMATYHLAAMVDDHDMEISHVLRSEEWLPSTPKHLLVYRAMDWLAPQFAHLPLLLAQDRKKLSKRIHGSAVWVRTYREEGYLPEAVVNYLALLGWNPGGNDELFPTAQLIERFTLDRVHKAGAMIDQTKLDAFQRHYVQELSTYELTTMLRPFAPADVTDELLARLTTVAQGRLGKLSDFSKEVSYLIELPDYDGSQLVFRKSTLDTTRTGLVSAIAALNLIDEQAWQEEPLLAQALDNVVAQYSLTNGDVFWPVRVGLTGQERSPSPAECLWVLGKSEGLRRLAIAQEKLAKLVAA